MLWLGILTWGVALYGFKVAFSGAPLVTLVRATPPLVLQQAANALTSEDELASEDEDANAFLRRFYYLSLWVLAMLALELGLAAYYAYQEPAGVLPWLVVSKNAGVMLVGWRWKQSQAAAHIFATVHGTPPWMLRLERASHLLSGLCFLLLFLKLHRVWPGS